MILAVIFCAFALIGIIRLSAYAVYTSQHHNKSGAAMLWTFVFVVVMCVVLAIMRL